MGVALHHEYWMGLALEQAQKAGDRDEVPVGAVLIAGNSLIAAAGNSCIRDHDPTAHAEINTLRLAGVYQKNYRLSGATLYVTLEPCVMCAGALVNARVDGVVYGCADTDAGAAGSVANILHTPFLNHQCKIVAGVLESRCRALLTSFFRDRRTPP